MRVLRSPRRAGRPPQLPAEPETLAAALSVYLGAGVEHLRVLASGWETTLYEFELRSRSETAARVRGGRCRWCCASIQASRPPTRARSSIATSSHLAGAGYPVPRPYPVRAGRRGDRRAISGDGAPRRRTAICDSLLSASLQDLLDGLSWDSCARRRGCIGWRSHRPRSRRCGDAGARANHASRIRNPGAKNAVAQNGSQDSAQDAAKDGAARAPARTHSRDRRGARRAGSAAGTGRGAGSFAPPARRSSETPHPRSSTWTTIRKTSWLRDYASPELSIGRTRRSATAISTPPPRR